jgi:murein DD-endopeptidase MepM/ murein hydrolase activator NlpD
MPRPLSCIALVVLLVAAAPGQGVARTAARRGAAAKPRSFAVQLPFPCGVQVKVSCGYGPSCSKAHKRTRSQGTNDYYALDLVRAERGNGRDKAVVAVAEGVVRIAGWARGGWAPYGKLVYIEHTFRDAKGRTYQTLYAHLHRVRVVPGQRVTAGTVIGTLGGSSRRSLSRYGPHLHFAMYRGARPTLGGGRAVVPEPFGRGHQDLRRGVVMEACGAPAPTVLAMDRGDTPAAGGL